MAFLATTERFAPDLDPCRKIYPNPSTYDPVVATVSSGSPFHTSSRYGTIGPHSDVPIDVRAAASPAAKALAAIETPPTSINSQRHRSPTPWHYAPHVRGQFARVYTVDDLETQRKERLETAKRTVAGSALLEEKPEQVQHLALGPGTYEVDKDWNLEQIAVPFSFGKEPRRGILDCTVGIKDRHADHHRMNKYSKRLSSEQRRRSETALLPLRRAATGSAKDPAEVAALSKELAKSYIELQRSAALIERKMASPILRNDAFQRFQPQGDSVEAYRRGPGSYFDQPHSARGSTPEIVSSSLPLDESQRQEIEVLLAKSTTHDSQHDVRHKKKASTFGLVKHRDMLTSMTRAGHLSAVAVESALGPGVYDSGGSTTLHEPTHNLLYKAGITRKTKRLPHRRNAPLGKEESEHKMGQQDSEQEIREKWLAMRRGPSL